MMRVTDRHAATIRALRALHGPSARDLIRQLPEARVGVDLAIRDLEALPNRTRLDQAERHLRATLALIERLRAAGAKAGEW